MPTPSSPPLPALVPAQLSAHLRQCIPSGGLHWRVGCAAEMLHGFLAHRFVTTLVLASALWLVGVWWSL